jgi:hypothetical protein
LNAKSKRSASDWEGTGVNWQTIKVATLTKSDKLVAYEAKVLINGKRPEIQVGPDGMPLPQEE